MHNILTSYLAYQLTDIIGISRVPSSPSSWHLGCQVAPLVGIMGCQVAPLNVVDMKDLIEVSNDDYVEEHHIRAGCLPSKARTSLGRIRDRSCRAGCGTSETNYHTIQLCHRTNGGRVLRHDRIVDMLAKHFKNRDRTQFLVEPTFKTSIGNRKPDLVLTTNGRTYLIDAQIVSGVSLDRDCSNKIT